MNYHPQQKQGSSVCTTVSLSGNEKRGVEPERSDNNPLKVKRNLLQLH